LDVLKNVGKLGGRADGSHVLSYPSVIIPKNTWWSLCGVGLMRSWNALAYVFVLIIIQYS
jgi:hypothetical protein